MVRTKPRPPLTKRLRHGHWVAVDFVVGAFFGAANFAIVLADLRQADRNGMGVPSVFGAMLFGAGILLAVGLRRYHPRLMLGLVLAGTVMLTIADGGKPSTMALYLPAAYILFLVVATLDGRRTAITTLAMIVGIVLVSWVFNVSRNGLRNGSAVTVAYSMFLVAGWAGGHIVRQRRNYAIGLQDEAASKAVAEERLRIARELHDIVAHSMSVIAVQAGYGEYVIDSRPGEARSALTAIQATSRDALDEMRRMLGALRHADDAPAAAAPAAAAPSAGAAAPAAGAAAPAAGAAAPAAGAGAAAPAPAPAPARFVRHESPSTQLRAPQVSLDPGTGGDAERAGFARVLRQMMRQDGAEPADAARAGTAGAPLYPAPGLADLGRLISRTEGAGVQVRLATQGAVRALPASIDLSAYRIIQEALTNVVKHAHTRACDVRIGYGADELTLNVTDGGSGVPGAVGALRNDIKGAGHGLTGMRERVGLLGGDFRAGPLPGYGFQVSARIPLPADPA